MLPQLFNHPAYAEDQRSAITILTIHCLHRGFTSGAIIGLIVPFARTAFTTILRRPAFVHALPWTARLLSSAAIGSLAGTALTAFGMTGRMWGREHVEWQDRSWRILANKGQNREDDWSLGGIILGAVGMGIMARRPGGFMMGISTWRAVVGGAAAGSVLATVGHVLTSSRSVEDVDKKVVAGEGPLKPKELYLHSDVSPERAPVRQAARQKMGWSQSLDMNKSGLLYDRYTEAIPFGLPDLP
ncbi:MAG: hypothetical protein Q9170_005389 [Blastenia crenularia]